MAAEQAQVCLAGRIMARRIMGSASFFELQDEQGKLQIYVKRDDICPGDDKTLYNIVFKRLLDIGDIVGVRGFVFRTQTGEMSVHAQELTLLSKSIRPLPIVKEKDGQVFTFMVESYLTGSGTDVYEAVKKLQKGDKVDLEGFCYWFDGLTPHITGVTMK